MAMVNGTETQASQGSTRKGGVFSNWLLQFAAEQGWSWLARFALWRGADVNAVDVLTGETALHKAVYNGHDKVVQHLIANGANVNAVNKIQENDELVSPLHIAARQGHISIVGLLISSGADVNITGAHENNMGETPLHVAARHNHAQIIMQLANANANPDAYAITGDTPLHTAAWHGHVAAIERLLQAGANPLIQNETGKTPLRVISSKGQGLTEAEQCLSNAEHIYTYELFKSLIGADEAYQPGEAMKRLLADHKIDINVNVHNLTTGNTPLHLAAMEHDPIFVKILIEHGADQDATNKHGEKPYQKTTTKEMGTFMKKMHDLLPVRTGEATQSAADTTMGSKATSLSSAPTTSSLSESSKPVVSGGH